MTNKIYTAEGIRRTVENLEWNRAHGMEEINIVYEHVIDQLRYAADAVEENAKLKARLETVVNRIDKQICHPSESNCKRCGDHRGNCQCSSISNNEMIKLLNLAKGG